MLSKEEDRLTIEDIEFKNIFNLFLEADEVSFAIFEIDALLGEKDLEIARECLEKDFQEHLPIFKERYKDSFDTLYPRFLEDIRRVIDTTIMKEIIMNDTSISLSERFKESRKYSNQQRLHIDECDIPLFQFLYDYEIRKTIIDKYVPAKDKNHNAEKFLDKRFSKIVPYIYKYEIHFETKSILHPNFLVKYFFKLNKESKKIFLSYEKGENINITEYALYKNEEMIFAYDYLDMLYYLDGDWNQVGGTLAN